MIEAVIAAVASAKVTTVLYCLMYVENADHAAEIQVYAFLAIKCGNIKGKVNVGENSALQFFALVSSTFNICCSHPCFGRTLYRV